MACISPSRRNSNSFQGYGSRVRGSAMLKRLFQKLCLVSFGRVRSMWWPRGCIQKGKRLGGYRLPYWFLRGQDSEFDVCVQIARRKVLPPIAGGARHRVLDLQETLLRKGSLCLKNVSRLTDIVRLLAELRRWYPRLELPTVSVPRESLPGLTLLQEWWAKYDENCRKSPSSKYEVWCMRFLL